MLRQYEEYVDLAHNNLGELLSLVEDTDLSVFERGIALEVLGLQFDEKCLPTLFVYVEHENPTLRVGAIHGLGGFIHLPALRGWLEKIAATDIDEDVREAARENI